MLSGPLSWCACLEGFLPLGNERLPGLCLGTKGAIHIVFLFEYAVDSFRQRIFIAAHCLGHADLQSPLLQPLDIFVAATLTPPIRVVNRPLVLE